MFFWWYPTTKPYPTLLSPTKFLSLYFLLTCYTTLLKTPPTLRLHIQVRTFCSIPNEAHIFEDSKQTSTLLKVWNSRIPLSEGTPESAYVHLPNTEIASAHRHMVWVVFF